GGVARHRVHPDPDHPAGPGRFLGRRQDRHQRGARQEPDRRVPPAPPGVGRHGGVGPLPRAELLAGYAEVVKYGLINDPAFFAWCEGHGAGIISGEASARRHAIAQSCKAKAAIVGADERESGARALLNLGHTFGHALEAECGYSDDLLHGEAVAIGMVMAYDLSARLGLCPLEDAARVQRHLASLGLPTSPAWID